MRLIGHDEFPDRTSDHHDFADRFATTLIRCFHEHLRDDRDQALRHEALALFALVGRHNLVLSPEEEYALSGGLKDGPGDVA